MLPQQKFRRFLYLKSCEGGSEEREEEGRGMLVGEWGERRE